MGVIAEAVVGLKSVLPRGSGRDLTFWSPWSTGLDSRFGLPDERDYSNLVGEGRGSSIVAATVGWIARQFPEAQPIITTDGPGGIRQPIPRDDPAWKAAELLRRPTWDPVLRRSWYSGALLRAALVTEFWIDGNAYALKVRNERDLRVVQLWWIPSWMIEPRGPAEGRTGFVDHYVYRPRPTTQLRIEPSDVWHVRQGVDPANPLKGLSGLKTALREIYTDEQAARFTASILKNRGVPGVILSPAKDSKKPIGDNERDAIKAMFIQKFSGDRSGEPMVMGQPTEIKEFGFSPDQLKLGDLRDIPEERITAITGIPASVVGLGAGKQQAGVGAKYAEQREQAYENNIIPTLRLFAEEYDGQVLPDFATDEQLEVMQTAFDLRDVGAVQDMILKKTDRANRMLSSGLALKNEARAVVGLPPVDGGDVFAPQPGVMAGGTPTGGDDGADEERPAAA